ncbi:hypothetical protein MJH12_06810 [bacterium]|nr:hypothetical protein [bacterium]
MPLEQDIDTKQIETPSEPFMIGDKVESSPLWSVIFLIALSIFICLLFTIFALNKNFGFLPYTMAILTIGSYHLHLRYIFYHEVDPIKKCIIRFSGRRGFLKPSTSLSFQNIHCVIIDCEGTKSGPLFKLIVIAKNGQKLSLRCISRERDPHIIEKAHFYASIFGVPFIDSTTARGCKLSYNHKGELNVAPVEVAVVEKKVKVLMFIVLLFFASMCAFSIYVAN